jgi:hypothetical protein
MDKFNYLDKIVPIIFKRYASLSYCLRLFFDIFLKCFQIHDQNFRIIFFEIFINTITKKNTMGTISIIAAVVASISKGLCIGVFLGLFIGGLYEEIKPQIKKCFKNIMKIIYAIIN